MKKIQIIAMACLWSIVLFAGSASAHVTVQPKEASQGAYEVFTVRVPTEKEVPTVKVEVKIPDEVTISRFEPKPDWTYEITRDATDKITSVVWTAASSGLASTEFGEFKMSGKVADDAELIAWKAYQTYEDGSVVEWVGAESSDTPASVTTVKAKAAGTEADSGESAAASSSSLSLPISVAALVLGVAAVLLSLLKKSTAVKR
ncbi:DUF1775 domain-containing protein [Paenibacillus nanensis]|uniref:DUF1775 domain-containing protein n=1 Tax=Paenibacillus nanensis TaxID=393251 RepID=A0A3A1V273_9BACL|nr:YcnI family protein [Paenibacillus nanensis]RIX53921.1 DUF1775 domain-containing protein [Paenibacillus nanensis]